MVVSPSRSSPRKLPGNTFQNSSQSSRLKSAWGACLVLLLIASWGITWVCCLGWTLPPGLPRTWQQGLQWGDIFLAILGRTLVQTGLFVLAHDAMHGSLIPQDKRLNHHLGQLLVGLYAGLNYHLCCVNHSQHHRTPAQVGDPDFHPGDPGQPFGWYLHFLGNYWSWRNGLGFGLTWGSLLLFGPYLFQLSRFNLLLFGLLPLALSSIQLFWFGTYLPHRGPLLQPGDRPPPNALQQICSVLSCYHLGEYHWEHHTFPQTPWYLLPQQRTRGARRGARKGIESPSK